MKKLFCVAMSLVLAVGLFAGCSSAKPVERKKLSVVTTIFPAYDWAKSVLGEKADDVDLTMLLDNGVDLHSFQPTADDIIAISSCDLFVYVGGESDGWVEDALKNATNPDMVVINLVDLLGDDAKAEEMVEGMEASEHHHDNEEEHDHEEHDHDHEEEPNHDHEDAETDEHVWLSLRNAMRYVTEIGNQMATLDVDNKDVYTANAKAYGEKLNNLDLEYATVVENATSSTILFGDRFPFRYLVEDYDLDYYAAFVGCSAETEASFETITFLANKVDELHLPVVLTIEGTKHQIAQTVVSATVTQEQQILALDSMQSTTSKDVEKGATYLSIMESNLEVLQTALQ